MGNTNCPFFKGKNALGCNFMGKGIWIVTENADGQLYALEADTFDSLIKDWEGDCDYVPANDAKVYFASVEGRPLKSGSYTNFEGLIAFIKEVLEA
ncbi:MAG: hypothetical protein UGF89_06560 [Acutalibacteraceae bacterium]|nr:hypothetical protein [Acutalibacteraceae bacterium]